MKRKMLKISKAVGYSVGLYPKKCEDCRYWSNVLANQFAGFGMCRASFPGKSGKMRAIGQYLETQPDFCCRLWRLK